MASRASNAKEFPSPAETEGLALDQMRWTWPVLVLDPGTPV